MVDKQLRDCINAITVTDRFRESKKKKNTYISDQDRWNMPTILP